MPAIDHLLEKKLELPAQVKDLGLARVSILLLTASFALLVVAPSIWLVVAGKLTVMLNSLHSRSRY